ncbi:M15 family metallopeptidase [Brevibacillus choshinensis]|uniref:M15 family metallopeptidase n=1 Tax=Brevibacillus choshinensis TaxID=54911 RepID=UPI002E1F1578|nr:M15 family metallopeptidase [Brevibacillus choshinensis]
MMTIASPIPAQPNLPESLPGIWETNEPLIPLKQYAPVIEVYPAYYHDGLPGSRPDCLVRQSVAERLLHAVSVLPVDHRLVILDGWRPLEVQQSLYDRLKNQLLEQGWTESDAFYEELHRYVARPTNNPARPPRHLTGGAVDLTITGPDGWLNMGTPFDDFSERASTRFFELHEPVDDSELRIRDNRRILYHAMIHAGFTNYSDEWWHFDFGNQAWAVLTGAPTADYGGILHGT